MNEWIDELADLCAAREPVVLVTVAGVRGSAPREAGAKMIVSGRETIGTIGGGQLEYQCSRIAVGMLDATEAPCVRTFPLGAAMGQCCGGVVEVLFEPMASGLHNWLSDIRALHGQREPATLVTGIGEAAGKYVVAAGETFGLAPDLLPPNVLERARALPGSGTVASRVGDYFLEAVTGTDFNIAVFGAGHVGGAVVAALSGLDCNLRWVDSRRNVFRRLPPNVRAIESAEPALEVAALPPDSFYLVMTHSHSLDFDICDRILRRGDAAYCGLIGSVTKRRRFEKRFRQQQMPEGLLSRLTCPIGVGGITGKRPAEIAVAVAAEILRTREAAARVDDADYPDNVRPIGR